MSPLSQTNNIVILLSIAITLLLLNNTSNFVLSLSNYPRSKTMLFSITVCTVLLYTASAFNIASNISGIIGFVFLFDTLALVILNDPSISSSTLIVSGLCCAILSVCSLYHNCLYLVSVLSCLWFNTTILSCVFLIVFTI